MKAPKLHGEPRPLMELRSSASQQTREDMKLVGLAVSWIDFAEELSVTDFQHMMAIAAGDLWGGYARDEDMLSDLGLANQGIEPKRLRERPCYERVKVRLRDELASLHKARSLEEWTKGHERLIGRGLTTTALLDDSTRNRLDALGQLADRISAKKSREIERGRTMMLPESFLEGLDGTLKVLAKHGVRLLPAAEDDEGEVIDASCVRVE